MKVGHCDVALCGGVLPARLVFRQLAQQTTYIPNDDNISTDPTGLVTTMLSSASIELELLSMPSLKVLLEMQVITTPATDLLPFRGLAILPARVNLPTPHVARLLALNATCASKGKGRQEKICSLN